MFHSMAELDAFKVRSQKNGDLVPLTPAPKSIPKAP